MAQIGTIKQVKYMRDEEYDNYDTQDFHHQAQCQLSEFNKKKYHNRKIPHKTFVDFNELVYDRREELRDQEYIDIMERLSRLLPNVTAECQCVPDSLQFCNSGIDEFLYCQNYQKWATWMPQIEFVKFYREYPSYSNKQLYEFLGKYCTEPLQICIGVNTENISKDYFMTNYVTVIENLITLCEANPVCKVGRALLIIMNFKFCLENLAANRELDFPTIHRLFTQMHIRCDILSYECVSPIRQQVQLILGWPECPFKTIQKIMVPFTLNYKEPTSRGTVHIEL